LKASADRTRSRIGRSARTLAAWLVVQSALAATILGMLQLVLLAILSRSGSSITWVVVAAGTVLVLQAVAANLLSVLANISFVGVVLSLYRQSAPPDAFPQHASATASLPRTRSIAWTLCGGLVAAMLLALVVSVVWVRGLGLTDKLEITAHRAGATAAPENSVAALRQAIADGADWAEIDVQLTKDQAIVVMHDIDLARVGGGNRRVDETTLAEIQTLDIGTPFGRQFAGERVPALADMLAAAEDRIRLNVELKPHSKEDGQELTRRVITEIRTAGMADRCRLCSQSYECLQLARQLEPQLELGYIVGASVGDPTQLEVDFLMVKSSLARRGLVDRAGARGIEVHAWTVNDPALVAPLLDAGVGNLITDDPARMRLQLGEIQGLGTIERLLLRAAHAVAR
jgi:glycerophosphoryl diester phosphodiesterase